MAKYIIGIDEAGRGPLAGPVSVGAVMVDSRMLAKIEREFSDAKDSKLLSPEKREEIFERMKIAAKEGKMIFKVSLSSSKIIDEKGIVPAIRRALRSNLQKLETFKKCDQCQILLDGALKAPKEFKNQQTIIRGDQKVKLISLASIAAKVTRDRKMGRLAKMHPSYGFEIHKGYGTALHYSMLRKNGISKIHRRSFLKNFEAQKSA